MGLIQWWEGHPRHRRNIVVVLILDAALLLCALLSVPFLSTVWDVLTRTVPNIYHGMLSQLLAVLFGLPADTGAGGAPLYYITSFLSLATFHLCVAFLVGFLLRKRENTMGWRITNYILLFVLLLTLHLIGTFFAYWAY